MHVSIRGGGEPLARNASNANSGLPAPGLTPAAVRASEDDCREGGKRTRARRRGRHGAMKTVEIRIRTRKADCGGKLAYLEDDLQHAMAHILS